MLRVARKVLRRVLVCALAYGLALQGLIISWDAAQAALGTADSAAFSEFTLCSHGATASTLPGTLPQGPVSDNNCIFCIVGAVYVNCAPASAPHVVHIIITEKVARFAAPRLLAPLVNQSAWPRGPPAAA